MPMINFVSKRLDSVKLGICPLDLSYSAKIGINSK